MDLATAIKAYEEATAAFLAAVNELDLTEIDSSNGEGWTPRQVIHHVADSEAQSYARLRRLIAEPGSLIQGYDEGKWGENETLGYKELPIEISIAVFSAVRASSLEILKRLSQDQLNHSGIHSETGEYSITTWIETYINHPKDHAIQIRTGL